MKDPITLLEGAGYTDLVESYIGTDAYSYVYFGQAGYLDPRPGDWQPGSTGDGRDHLAHQRR